MTRSAGRAAHSWSQGCSNAVALSICSRIMDFDLGDFGRRVGAWRGYLGLVSSRPGGRTGGPCVAGHTRLVEFCPRDPQLLGMSDVRQDQVPDISSSVETSAGGVHRHRSQVCCPESTQVFANITATFFLSKLRYFRPRDRGVARDSYRPHAAGRKLLCLHAKGQLSAERELEAGPCPCEFCDRSD